MCNVRGGLHIWKGDIFLWLMYLLIKMYSKKRFKHVWNKFMGLNSKKVHHINVISRLGHLFVSIFHQIGLRQMRQLQRGNTNKSIISQWNF